MSKLSIKSGKGELTLKKSKTLVGLKTKSEKPAPEEAFVRAELLRNLGGFSVVTLEEQGKSVDEQLDNARSRTEVDIGTHVYYVEGSNKPIIATGEIYISFKEGVSEAEQGVVLEELHLKLVERRSPDQIVARVTAQSANPFKCAVALGNIPMVKHAEPDIDTVLEEYAVTMPRDGLFTHQWHLQNKGRLPDVSFRVKFGADAKVVDAWKRLGNLGSSSIVVAVIDNGFDLTHPDLKSKVHRPFDLWNNSPRLNQGDPRYSHGTPCASVAIAAANGSGIVGAAPNAKFMPVSGTSFSLRATEKMFDYCVKNGADIISCSWGTTDSQYDLSPLKEQAIAKAARQGRNGKGCVILYAVGNDDKDYINYYADHPDVIAVAASNSQDKHASYSNRGRRVTICAPSNGDWPITAARAWWDEGLHWESGHYKYWRDGRARGDRYKHFGGTSSSTPLVAGICALILSANPKLTARQVKQILIKTADKIGSPSEYSNGHSRKYGYGRVNADKAVAEALRLREGTVAPIEMEETVSSGQGLFCFSVKKQASRGWGVQVGVYAEYGNVLVAAEKLKRKFGAPIIVNINELNGKTVYKVVAGAYDDVNKARTLFNRMKNAGISGFLRNLKDLA